MHLELSRIGSGDLGKRRQRALIAFNGNDVRGAFGEEGAGQTAGPGADFDDGAIAEGCGGARYTPREIEVEEEVLSKGLVCAKPVFGDYIPQRRQAVASHGQTNVRGEPLLRIARGPCSR